MKVLVDTSIWSYAFRKRKKMFEREVQALINLISDKRVVIIGPIRQELLSGYSNPKDFEALKEKLECFENAPVLESDYIDAAHLSNVCRKNGIQGSHIDFLICAVALRLNIPIFTADKDFSLYQKHIPITLYDFQ